jgi:hypothetical protein
MNSRRVVAFVGALATALVVLIGVQQASGYAGNDMLVSQSNACNPDDPCARPPGS